MDLDLEMLRDEGIHPVIDHEDRTVDRIVDRKVQNGTKEIMMDAKLLDPFFKLSCPLFLVFFEIVPPIKQESQLVVAVIPETENSHQIQVEFVKMAVITLIVLGNLLRHFVHNTQRIVFEQVLDLDVINQVVKE